MGWSLGYLPPAEPELLDRFFLTIGKALFPASAFEAKCQLVLRAAKLAQHYEKTGDASATIDLASALADPLLGQILREMDALRYFEAADVVLLDAGREARNFIAHEVGDLRNLWSVQAPHVHERIAVLRHHLDALIAADNVVSRWVYEIEEKEQAPNQIQQQYPEWVKGWVFREFNDALRADGSHATADEAHRRSAKR